MPQDTRWNTVSDCLKIYVYNWPILMKICEVNREMIDPCVRDKVFNLGLKRSAEELLVRLQPIAKTLDQVQNNKCTIAQAADIWRELYAHFTNTRQVKKLMRKGMNNSSPRVTCLPKCFILHFRVKYSIMKR